MQIPQVRDGYLCKYEYIGLVLKYQLKVYKYMTSFGKSGLNTV